MINNTDLLTNEIGDNKASVIDVLNVISGNEADAIQAAKDFIWQHLEPHQRELFIHQATTDSLKKNNLSIKRLIVGYDFH